MVSPLVRSGLNRMLRSLSRLSLLSVAAACAHGSRAPELGPNVDAPGRDSVLVRVASQYPGAVTVALVREHVQTTLGEVSAAGVGRFPLPASAVTGAGLELVATPVAGHETVHTLPFRMHSGQVAWLEVSPTLAGSRVLVKWPEEFPRGGARPDRAR